jgi:acyl-CoA synthetase (AMP-forming)/AMP-acid ligase II
VLHGADGVAEAAVVGVPDERLGQAVVAHVSGIVADAAALRAFCAAHLESHMVPARIVLHDGALPRTPNGKVDRRALAEWPA